MLMVGPANPCKGPGFERSLARPLASMAGRGTLAKVSTSIMDTYWNPSYNGRHPQVLSWALL